MDLYTRVTGVLVTGKTEDRFPLARRAVTSWQRQLYSTRRELLIINDHPTQAVFPEGAPEGVRELRLTTRYSLGALRNIGIEQATSEYLVQWDDDDYSANTRLTWQIEHTIKGRASILRYEVHCDSEEDAFVNDGQTIRGGGFPGTMLWPKDTRCRFPNKGKREDTEFVWQLRRTCGLDVLSNDPTLYCRFYHGSNTWSKQHIMQRKPGSRRLTDEERRYIQQILNQTKQLEQQC